MIETYDLSFLDLNKIKNILLRSNTETHGLITNGISSYNVGVPILMDPKLKEIKIIIEKYLKLYCSKYNISPVHLINSWFNITKPGNKLKMHKHEESVISGAFYMTNGVPLIFPNKKIYPYPGLLCIFDSDLNHYTEEETQERIVVSFNTDYL